MRQEPEPSELDLQMSNLKPVKLKPGNLTTASEEEERNIFNKLTKKNKNNLNWKLGDSLIGSRRLS
jgi:hypothetical protein